MRFFQTIRPSHLGLLFVHMWIYCSTHRDTETGGVSVMAIMYVALSLCLVIVLLRSFKTSFSAGAKRRVDVGAVIAMACSAVLLACPLPFSGAAATAFGSALGGVGVAWTYVRWGEFYAQLDIHYATPLIFLTMAVGSVGKTLVDFLPPLPAGIVLALLPVATFLCLHRACGSVPQASEPYRYYNDRTVGSLWRLALGIGVYSFTVGITQSMSLAATPSPYYLSVLVHHGGEVAIALALFLWVVLFRRGLGFSRTWRLVLLLMATALIFVPYLDATFTSYLLALIRIAQTFLIIFLFLALGDIARHGSYRPSTVFAAGWVTYSLPFAVGELSGTYLQTLGSNAAMVMAAIVWVLVIVTLFFMDEASVGNHLIFTELNDGGDEDTPANRLGALQQDLNDQRALSGQSAADSISVRSAALAKAYQLTPREHEILELLARGRSKAYIADAFFISENTVRGHVKRLYAKLDVHSKQELVDKVEMVDL